MESHKTGFPRFPHSLEIPSGLPHFHGLDYKIRYFEAMAKISSKSPLKPLLLQKIVRSAVGWTAVSGHLDGRPFMCG
jgi:hypothetical protein